MVKGNNRYGAHHYLSLLSGVQKCLLLKDLAVLVDPGSVLWIVFDLKDRPVNVFNLEVVEQAHKALDAVDHLIKDGKVKAVVIASGKSRSFIAGADIDQMYPNVDLSSAVQAASTAQSVFNRIASCPVITISCINGPALGGGLELALACDFRLCSDNPKVQLGLPEVKLGLLPGGGGTVRLPKLIGLQAALGMILSGGSVRASKALLLGLADRIIPEGPGIYPEDGFFLGARDVIIQMINQKRPKRTFPDPTSNASFKDRFLNGTSIGNAIVARKAAASLDKLTKGKYPAPYLALESIIHSMGKDTASSLKYEAQLFGQLAVSPESKSLIALFYMTERIKRRAATLLSAEGQTLPVKKIGIVGAGVMGAQIAAIAVAKGYRVYIRDIKSELAEEGMKLALNILGARRPLSADTKSRLSSGTSLDGFRDCEVIIEAAVERMDLKQKILNEIESVVPASTVFATNTSSLSINTLATVSRRPGSVCGMHFFNPVKKMPLVEVIRGGKSNKECIARIYQLALNLGKTPVFSGDGPGFIVNRILGIYLSEAGWLALEGNSIELIDTALVEFGMPMGPFRLMDEVGHDVASHIGPLLEAGLGPRFKQAPAFAKLIGSFPHHLGKKSGSGFYLYGKDGRNTKLNSVLTDAVTKAARAHSKHSPASKTDIVDRCILVALQEACRILDDGICSDPEDLDLAVVFGLGFAPFRGGLLNYADQRGIADITSRLRQLSKTVSNERFEPVPKLVHMETQNKKFFPKRPHGMTEIKALPRCSISSHSKL